MIRLLCFTLAVLTSSFKSKLRLEAENAVLRHQLIVVRRRLHRRVRLTNRDRWFLIQYRRFPSGSHNHPARDARCVPNALAKITRLLTRLELVLAQIAELELERDAVAKTDAPDQPGKMIQQLISLRGIGVQSATVLVTALVASVAAISRAARATLLADLLT
jgi:hypothetical protein